MNHSIVLDKFAEPNSGTLVPNDDSTGTEIPLYEVEFLEFSDRAIAHPYTQIHGIAPWDMWLEQSKLRCRQHVSSGAPIHKHLN